MTTPVLPDYAAPFKPVPNVTPFTIRDGVTMLKKIDYINKYIDRVLIPWINENFAELADEFETQVNALLMQVNAALTEQSENVTEQLNLQDAEVEAQLASNLTTVNTAITNLTTYVDAAVATIIGDSVVVQDPVVAGIFDDEESDTRVVTDLVYASNDVVRSNIKFPLAHNQIVLSDIRQKIQLSRREYCIINEITDSIGWGVGVDNDPDQDFVTTFDATQQAIYREMAHPQLLAERIANLNGVRRTSGWLGTPYSDVTGYGGWAVGTPGYTGVTATAAARSANVGPFGNHTGAQRGGNALASPAYVEYHKYNDIGTRFTELDVYYFGIAATVTNPTDPEILIDGVSVYTSTGVAEGSLMKITITGLTDDYHTVRIYNNQTAKTVYWPGIVVRRANGVVVNRIGSPGATTSDIIAAGGTPQRDRIVATTVMNGDVDLNILLFNTNDHGNQVPIATFKSNIQVLLDASGTTPWLLMGGPPRNNPTGAITPEDYMTALIEISDANPTRIAAANIADAFPVRAKAVELGLFASSTTVHPSFKGHQLIADYLYFLLTA